MERRGWLICAGGLALLFCSASVKAIQTQNLPAIATGLPIFFLIFSHEAVGKEGQPESQRTSTNDDKNGEQGVHVFFRRSFEVSHGGQRQLPGVGCSVWSASSFLCLSKGLPKRANIVAGGPAHVGTKAIKVRKESHAIEPIFI